MTGGKDNNIVVKKLGLKIFNKNNIYLITDQRGEHNGTPLPKTMFYIELILFKQAGAPSGYGPMSKYRVIPCSKTLVGAAED